MGLEKNKAQESKARNGKRGSTNNKNRLDAFARAKVSAGADWGGCDAATLQACVVAITELGGAITIGLSRDMGAHSLTLLLDGGRETLWFNGSADLDAELNIILATLEALR